MSRIITFAPDRSTMRWVQDELDGENADLVTTGSVGQLLETLADTAVAIVDFDALDFDGTRLLRLAREDGWHGFLIALGTVDYDERRSLRIRASVPRPFGSERLRKAVGDLFAQERRRQRAVVARAARWHSEFTQARDS